MGIDTSDPDEVYRNRIEDDFNLLVGTFISDLLDQSGDVSSRSNKEQIVAYARKLDTIEGRTGERVNPEPIQIKNDDAQEQPSSRPKKPSRFSKLPHSDEISEKLLALDSYKLQHLYSSLCRIGLRDNTPLLSIGTWAFFESLTARAGRNSRTSFTSFFSNERLQRYGFAKGTNRAAISSALDRIAAYGNTTKHHETAATFNGEQLANDWETLEKLIVKCADEALSGSK